METREKAAAAERHGGGVVGRGRGDSTCGSFLSAVLFCLSGRGGAAKARGDDSVTGGGS
jgi:hypothetical protein